VILAFFQWQRTSLIIGVAITASPIQLGILITMFFGSILFKMNKPS